MNGSEDGKRRLVADSGPRLLARKRSTSLQPLKNLTARRLVLRWTIGQVRDRGFELLRISITCAFHTFGSAAEFVVCVNSIPVEEARDRTGPLPLEVEWRQVTRVDLPGALAAEFGEGMMDGMGWKLAPVRVSPDAYELAIDNDCVLWAIPEALQDWLDSEHGSLFAEDVARCLGAFDPLCPPGCFNAGIRGVAPHVDVERALGETIAELKQRDDAPAQLSEIDEQGLQAAAVHRISPTFLVRTAEVSICSPFWPGSQEFGSCGAHFIGANAFHLPWDYHDIPADDWVKEHWERQRPALYAKAGLRCP